jgi:hypothetical protein
MITKFRTVGQHARSGDSPTRGILYAMTDDGLELPVIDVTNPVFAVTATDAQLAAMSDQFVRESESRQQIPAPLRDALQRSMLGRGLMAASGTFLTGMSTYLLKVGPDNLGTDADPVDRRIAASFPAFVTRLRLQDMARLLADSLSLTFATSRERPLCLINIAGGSAADSWNALIHLHAEHPDVLPGRQIVIAVLDVDDHGPAFGARALDALRSAGAPLSGLEIGFRHIKYDWSEADRLRHVLDDLDAMDTACAISSEGGLFEYGSDQEIITNLRTLHAGTSSATIVVGSVTRDGEPVRSTQMSNRVSTRPRTIEAFRGLAEQGGWIVQDVLERPFSYSVRLAKRC